MNNIKKDKNTTIAALIPCLNEEKTIALTIKNIKKFCSKIDIYVCDNDSTDQTSQIAKSLGAYVIKEERKGKGYAMDRLFQHVNADYYLMVDGDNTYDVSKINKHLDIMLAEEVDMLIGVRNDYDHNSFPKGHKFGNKLFNKAIEICFGKGITDVLSGYRILSKKYVKSFPNLSRKFDIEVEMSVHALELNVKIVEQNIKYFKRPEGSLSKLNTYSDGLKILSRIIIMLIDSRPIYLFSIICLILLVLSMLLLFPILNYWLDFGTVPRIPTFILGAFLLIIGFTIFLTGLILDSISRHRIEEKKVKFKLFDLS